MARGSKFGRALAGRAERSVRLLRDINTMRAIGYRRGNETERESLARHERKLKELDEIHGYNKSRRLVHGHAGDFHALQPGEVMRQESQGERRRAK